MSIRIVSASTQYLQNSAPPAFTYPFTVAMWTRSNGTLASRTFWVWSDNTTTNNYFEIGTTVSGNPLFTAQAGASVSTMNVAGGGAPMFVVARAISATLKRFSILSLSGVFFQTTSDTTNATPSGLNTMALGARITSAGVSRGWDGWLSEFWWTNNDVQPDGGTIDGALMRKLAYDGPFAIPHVAQALVEYHSFRRSVDIAGDSSVDSYFGGAGRQTWTAVNGPTVGLNISDSSRYVRPPGRRNIARPFMPELFFGTASTVKRRRSLLILG